MVDILKKIIINKRRELEEQKQEIPIHLLEKKAADISVKYSLKEALLKSETGIIAEFKRRSPSRDWIFKDAKIEDIIPFYSKNGATAISVLTDFDFFGGTLSDLEKASELASVPLLRKDFIIDEYQLYRAKCAGASAILLIASALTVNQTIELAAKAKELGLDVLLEIHNEKELAHIHSNIDVVGVNNRNLNTFETDMKISFDLANLIPNEFVKISESGISKPETVKGLKSAGFKGFLMGENFMKTNNPGKALEEFIEKLRKL